MDELRVDITGSNRGFVIATEQTKQLAKNLKRDLEQSTPETWKGAYMMRDKYKEVFAHLKGSQGMGGFNNALGAMSGEMGGMFGRMASMAEGLISKFGKMLGVLGLVAGAGKIAWSSMSEAFTFTRDASMIGVSASFLDRFGDSAELQMMKPEETQAKLFRASDMVGKAITGEKSAKQFFDSMGIELQGKTMEQILLQIAEAFREIKDPAEKAHRAVELFGRGGQTLIPVLEQLKKESASTGSTTTYLQLFEVDDETIAREAKAFKFIKNAGTRFGEAFKNFFHNSVGGLLDFIGVKGEPEDPVKLKAQESPEEKAAKAKAIADHARDLATAQERYRKAVEGSVNPQTRLMMLMVDLDNLKRKRAGTKDDVERLNIDADIATKQKEIKDQRAEMQKTWDKSQKKDLADKQMSHIDNLSSMGLFTSAGAVTNPVLDVNRKQLEKLTVIAENTTPKTDMFA